MRRKRRAQLIISEKKEEDSFDETENEYNDVHFEMLVMEEDRRSRRKIKSLLEKSLKVIGICVPIVKKEFALKNFV